MRILQIYDHIGINCGIMSVIMNWYRNIDTDTIQFDFLVAEKRNASYESEIKSLGGSVYYMSDKLSVSHVPEIIKNTKKFMKENAKKYAAVHLHTHTFAYPYLYYAKKYGVAKRISHAHSISLGNTPLANLRNRIMVYPLKFFANNYLACSDRAGSCLYDMLGIKKYETLLNGIDFEKYKYDAQKRTEMRKKLNLDKTDIAVIHISNMTPIKNVPFVVKVFSQMNLIKKCKLILVGKSELPQEVVETIQDRGIENDVINLGVCSDVPDILQAADVCLMPSESEGLGIVAIESQAANVPVITSLGFPKDIYVTDIIQKCDLKSELWAEKALELISKRDLQVNLDIAKDKYDIKSIVQKIAQHYKE